MSYPLKYSYLADISYDINKNYRQPFDYSWESSTWNNTLAGLEVYDAYAATSSALMNVKEWVLVDFMDSESGYQGGVFYNYKTQEIVLVSRGAKEFPGPDGTEAVGILFDKIPAHVADAKKLYGLAQKFALSLDISPSEIVFVGHSLGGSLAMLLGAEYGHTTVTFNPLDVELVSDKRNTKTSPNSSM